MNTARFFRFTLGFAAAGLLALPQAAYTTTLGIGDDVGATGYRLADKSGGLTFNFTDQAANDGNQFTTGTIDVVMDHPGTFELKFRLKQKVAPGADSDNDGGLRVLLNVRDTNGMTLPWVDYHIRANDFTPDLPAQDNSGHRREAHFHARRATSNPLVMKGPNNNVLALDYGLGAPVAPGNDFTANNILVHERDYANRMRDFEITFAPSVSEPETLALVGLGAMAVLGWRRRRVGPGGQARFWSEQETPPVQSRNVGSQ